MFSEECDTSIFFTTFSSIDQEFFPRIPSMRKPASREITSWGPQLNCETLKFVSYTHPNLGHTHENLGNTTPQHHNTTHSTHTTHFTTQTERRVFAFRSYRNIFSEVDLESSRSPAKYESRNEPYRQCCAALPK